MKIRWRIFSFLVCGWLLLIGIWLIWQLPDQGFFRLDLKSVDLPEDGVVLVEFKEGKLANSYPLASAGQCSGNCGPWFY